MQPPSRMPTRPNGSRTGFLDLPGTPPLLRPLLRAYLLGYASSVTPRLLTLLLQHVTQARKRHGAVPARRQWDSFLAALQHIILTGFDWRRFPTFCAVLVGGSTLLEEPLRRFFHRAIQGLSDIAQQRLSRWTSTFIAAWLGVRLLQSKESAAFTELREVPSEDGPGQPRLHEKKITYAGRTLDLTLFAFTRAADVLVGELWTRRRARRKTAQKWTRLEDWMTQAADPCIFACSCALIMWAWFYTPSRLPRSYRKWIASAASVDNRLIEALQRCKTSELRYGQETGQAPLLQSMCKEYGWPLAWGDPAVSVPFPCEMVHMGCGSSCEYHALSRLYRSWRWSMAMYLPLNFALQLRKPPTPKRFVDAVISASRSSAFLGLFIALFYYGVCLGRTRLGPRLVGKDTASRQAIDSGICVGCGCAMCGWSVLVETASRRKDMALFVAPRALATLFPRRYALNKQWRETIAFAASTAVVFTCVRENPDRVRGVLGKILHRVLRT